MYVLLLFILACLLGWLLWRRLFLTSLHPAWRAVLTTLCIIVLFVIFFWVSAYFSLFEL